MALQKQKFLPKVTIDGTNNRIDFSESGVPKFATLTTGSFFPDAIALEIGSVMTTASGAQTFTCAFNAETGIPTVTASTSAFVLLLTATENNKFFTGGDVAAGAQGQEHFGFVVQAAAPAAALSFSGSTSTAGAWFPDQPRASWNAGASSSSAVQAVSMGGKASVYDFSGRQGDYLKEYALSYERLSEASRTQYEGFFWPYAKQGEGFQFYEDRSSASYTEMLLWSESLQTANFQRTDPGLARWSLDLKMRKVKP